MTKTKILSNSNIKKILNTHLNTNNFREMTTDDVNSIYKKIITDFSKLNNKRKKKKKSKKKTSNKNKFKKRPKKSKHYTIGDALKQQLEQLNKL